MILPAKVYHRLTAWWWCVPNHAARINKLQWHDDCSNSVPKSKVLHLCMLPWSFLMAYRLSHCNDSFCLETRHDTLLTSTLRFYDRQLTVNMVFAAQWIADFEAEHGPIENCQAQPLTSQGDQAQPLTSQGHQAQPLGHQAQLRDIHAQSWGFPAEPFAAVMHHMHTDRQLGSFLTQPSGYPQTVPRGCCTQPLSTKTRPLGVQAQHNAVVSNTAEHGAVNMTDSLQPDTPEQKDAKMLHDTCTIDNNASGKLPVPTEQQHVHQDHMHQQCYQACFASVDV